MRFPFFDLVRVGRSLRALRLEIELAAFEHLEGDCHRHGALLRENFCDLPRSGGGIECQPLLKRDRTRIKTSFHPHDAESGLHVASHDCPLDGRGPTPARQQRSMQIEATQRRRCEDGGRKNEAVGHNNCGVGAMIGEGKLLGGSAQARGSQNRDGELVGQEVRWCFRQMQAAPPRWFGRARIDGHDLVAGAENRSQRWRRKVRSAHEDDTHRIAIASSQLRVKAPKAIGSMKIKMRNQSAGKLYGGTQRFELRVYYEDTDFSGYVYHASYLRFMERARTEWLRALGFEQGDLQRGEATTFAVRRVEIDYLRPAKMDDALTIETRIVRVGGASVDFEQTVARGAETLVVAFVGVALLRNSRPARIPSDMKTKILELTGARAPKAHQSNAANL